MQDILFYDGQCNLCRSEIRWLSQYKNTQLLLLDVHTENLDPYGIDKITLLSLLHYRRHDGVWLTGLDATVAAWRQLSLGLFLYLLDGH